MNKKKTKENKNPSLIYRRNVSENNNNKKKMNHENDL